ncbi:MAG: pyridoxal phosphate-dependent aminotransferase [Syntrophobacterales bacterium]|jgi:cystathionine beta-lyase|nr:pyridoxal phosphate-dependent aminotransferase [Syntrophobacterales bacterium]
MKYDFDRIVERKNTDSIKWQRYGNDVIPAWVADMDFVSPEPIIRALHERVDHRIFGYSKPRDELVNVILERLKRLYEWDVLAEQIIFVPGVVTGLNFVFQLFAGPGNGVLVQPPVYSHFITDPVLRGQTLIDPPLIKKGDTYEIDFDAFEKAITSRTKIYVLSNPHNPVGRVFLRDELERLAEICFRHNILICADEIHCDLIYKGFRHLPIATLGQEVADRTITFMSPSKTFNLAGLSCSFAIIANPCLREAWVRGSQGLMPFVNVMGLTAAMAGYKDGQEWLDQCLSYLQGNRDFLAAYVRKRLPSLSMTRMEGTYLAWLDCRQSGIPGNPFHFFLKNAGVALNSGVECGRGGEGFVRLNFACPRKTLADILERMASALNGL